VGEGCGVSRPFLQLWLYDLVFRRGPDGRVSRGRAYFSMARSVYIYSYVCAEPGPAEHCPPKARPPCVCDRRSGAEDRTTRVRNPPPPPRASPGHAHSAGECERIQTCRVCQSYPLPLRHLPLHWHHSNH
jgi:hypothetical protein